MFNCRSPHLLVVDDFYAEPDKVREMALELEYVRDDRFYKGRRSKPCLFPYVREWFQELLGKRITDWTQQPANGCMQITDENDELVYHSDSQDYAGVIYLTPDAPIDTGTSFWRDRTYGCRRPPGHPMESRNNPEVAHAAIYDEPNLTSEAPWEMVDRVGNVYGRLVLWDGRLIHSASAYKGERLVQLFFMNVA